jgi:hypothetical protein
LPPKEDASNIQLAVRENEDQIPPSRSLPESTSLSNESPQ